MRARGVCSYRCSSRDSVTPPLSRGPARLCAHGGHLQAARIYQPKLSNATHHTLGCQEKSHDTRKVPCESNYHQAHTPHFYTCFFCLSFIVWFANERHFSYFKVHMFDSCFVLFRIGLMRGRR